MDVALAVPRRREQLAAAACGGARSSSASEPLGSAARARGLVLSGRERWHERRRATAHGAARAARAPISSAAASRIQPSCSARPVHSSHTSRRRPPCR